MTASDIISHALQIAGNTGLSTTEALNALNNFLQAEYRRKYPWQRKTVTITTTKDVVTYPGAWDATYLGLYQQKDGSVGRYLVPNSTAPGQYAKTTALDYREYIAKVDRLTAQGAPRNLIADDVGATWYVYPSPDQGYTIDVDIYYLPALLALGTTPLWSSFAPDEILVQLVKVWALDWMDDDRRVREAAILYGDDKARVPGMLPTYRRRIAAAEGTVFQTALDQRVFAPMYGWNASDATASIWD